MSTFSSFAKKLAKMVYNGDSDADSPECPECGSTMCFHGGDRELGEGYWDCPGCDFTISESDLDQYM